MHFKHFIFAFRLSPYYFFISRLSFYLHITFLPRCYVFSKSNKNKTKYLLIGLFFYFEIFPVCFKYVGRSGSRINHFTFYKICVLEVTQQNLLKAKIYYGNGYNFWTSKFNKSAEYLSYSIISSWPKGIKKGLLFSEIFYPKITA